MLQEYPFFSFSPVNVIFQNLDLGFRAIGYRSKIIEQSPDWAPTQHPISWTERNSVYALSLAVLAFAVEDMKALDIVMTSARPSAFLSGRVSVPLADSGGSLNGLLIPVEFC